MPEPHRLRLVGTAGRQVADRQRARGDAPRGVAAGDGSGGVRGVGRRRLEPRGLRAAVAAGDGARGRLAMFF